MTTLRFTFPGGQLELSLTNEAPTAPDSVIEVRGVDVTPIRPGIVKAVRANVVAIRKVG